jgi:hypothetical protein
MSRADQELAILPESGEERDQAGESFQVLLLGVMNTAVLDLF